MSRTWCCPLFPTRDVNSDRILMIQVNPMQLLAKITHLIIDMDGVLWRDDQALLDMPGFFSAVKGLGIPVVFAPLGWESELVVCDNNSKDRTSELSPDPFRRLPSSSRRARTSSGPPTSPR